MEYRSFMDALYEGRSFRRQYTYKELKQMVLQGLDRNDIKRNIIKKKAVLLYASLIALIALGVYNGYETDESAEDIIDKYGINGDKEYVDTIVERLKSRKIDYEDFGYTTQQRILNLSYEITNFDQEKFENSVFKNCDVETLKKLKKMDEEIDWFNSAELVNPDNLSISEYGINLLKTMEHFVDTAKRKNNEDYCTGGWGHYGPDVKEGEQISIEQGEKWLRSDIKRFERLLKNECRKWIETGKFAGLSQDMFDAIIIYMYNRGHGTLINFSDLTKEVESLKTSDYDKCVDIIKFDRGEKNKGFSTVESKKAEKFPGWKKRRALEGELFMGNKYNPKQIFKLPKQIDSTAFDSYPEIDTTTLLQHLQQKEYRS